MVTGTIFLFAIALLIFSLIECFYDPSIAATLLNFFSTVIVSWLFSNWSNEKSFKKKQQDLAKVSHRHLGDVEKSALNIEQSIKDFVGMFQDGKDPVVEKAVLILKTLDSRMDDLKERIKSTNRDWYDLLSDDAKKEIDGAEDPEAFISKLKSTPKPDISDMANMYKDVVDKDKAVNK